MRLLLTDVGFNEESDSGYGTDDSAMRLQYAVSAAASEASREMPIQRRKA